ncbi:MAG: TIM barrel protein [Pseudomonadota bacterium]
MLKLCANISCLFTELPFLERPLAARLAGFGAIEFHTAQGHSPAAIAAVARDAGVTVALFNAWPGDLLMGGVGLSGVPGRQGEFAVALDQACQLGEALPGACVQIGQSRVPDGIEREQCLEVFYSNLRLAAQRLRDVGCRPLVEAVNRHDAPGMLIGNVAEAIDAIDHAGAPGLGLQFDCYHEAMAGGDVCAEIARCARRMDHLQFSDAPGRGEPGTGTVDFTALWSALVRVEYAHWIAAEYRPSTDTNHSLGWLARVPTHQEYGQ